MNIDKITPQIAALYLGQKCEFESYGKSIIGKIWSVNLNGEIKVVGLESKSETTHKNTICTQTPLCLRRLESITEEEAQELYSIENGEKWDDSYPCLNWLGHHDYFGLGNKLGRFVGIPEGWLYLLSKGFDVFGLIDLGLAKEVAL